MARRTVTADAFAATAALLLAACAGGDLPDGTFGTTQDMNVQKIQAIDR
ncbi:hypothetical protein [Streptomyces sp. 2A115]